MNRIDALREACRKLQILLDDPQPGLFTWNQAVYEGVREIAEFVEGPEAENKRLREVARLAELASCVSHLLDTDENDGQWLRKALAQLKDLNIQRG